MRAQQAGLAYRRQHSDQEQCRNRERSNENAPYSGGAFVRRLISRHKADHVGGRNNGHRFVVVEDLRLDHREILGLILTLPYPLLEER